jgi:hypothetical protein
MELTSAREVARLRPDGVKNEATPAIDEGFAEKSLLLDKCTYFALRTRKEVYGSFTNLHRRAPAPLLDNHQTAIARALERS